MIPKPLIVRAAAAEDMAVANGHYRTINPSLAAAFLDEVRAVFERIAQLPLAFPLHWDAVRRASLKQFPYILYFIVGDDATAVLACCHKRRNPEDLLKSLKLQTQLP